VLFLIPVAMTRRREPAIRPFVWKYLGWAAVAGILAGGIGSLFYIAAVQEAGAGRTAILTSTMPLFTLPLTVLSCASVCPDAFADGACVIGYLLYEQLDIAAGVEPMIGGRR
jgi:uncharacterized membrane protein